MTPDDLDAIRDDINVLFDNHFCCDEDSCELGETGFRAVQSLPRLLAEVDRLTAMLDTSEGKQEVSEGLWAEWTTGERLSYGMGYRRGLAANAERARIVEAVQRLPVYPGADYTSGRVDRAAVLAAIDDSRRE